MIRQCIGCGQIFGCYGADGAKCECCQCQCFYSCSTRTLSKLPIDDITGGICDWCWENIIIAKRKNRCHEATIYESPPIEGVMLQQGAPQVLESQY